MNTIKKIFNITLIFTALFSLSACNVSKEVEEKRERRLAIDIKDYYYLLNSYQVFILKEISNLNNLDDSTTVRDLLSKENFDALSLLENIEDFNTFVNELGEYCINDESGKSSLLINDSTSISELKNLKSNIKNSCQKAENLISTFNAKEKQRLLKKISDND